ncbi:DUF2512 family protein [Desulfofalx alkaliphila]|uniref:DUF2512 family protein n=1 Tax=Desulfofalx alkaliphila TaxID=105483 RepID=UPI0004E1644F|nr:DUF2512 family protein [Desulfofalx alkaliphila]
MEKFNHATALIIKFVAMAIILVIALPMISTMNIFQSLITAVVLTALAYAIGDLYILSASNNIYATLADAGMAFAIIWFMNFLLTGAPINLGGLLVLAVIIGAVEYFFHKYVAGTVLEGDKVEVKEVNE